MIEKGERAALAKALVSVIKEHFHGFTEKLKALEKQIAELPKPEKGEKGDPGKDGQSITGPAGPPGPKGQDGKDAVIDYPLILSEAVKLIPIPQNGRDGRDGANGRDAIVDHEAICIEVLKRIPIPKDGKDGEPGPQGPAGAAAVVDYHAIIADVLKQIPTPKDGRDGKNGIDGKDGRNGERGEPGRDAVVDYNAIITEAVSRIPVPKDGKDGASIKGDRGDIGEQGPQGIRGERGEKGESIKGDPGRDALQLDILSSIDLSRSYPRGTYARYENGLIRSFRDTVPGESLEKSGWEVIVAGTSSIRVEMSSDCRTITVKTGITGKEIQNTTFAIPSLIYRGIYRQEEKYQQGDVVTWGGSAWHCQVNDCTSAPGKNGDWKLMVKEGQRGKDGKDGERGPQGPAGPRGMDNL